MRHPLATLHTALLFHVLGTNFFRSFQLRYFSCCHHRVHLLFRAQIALQCACASGDSGEARNTLDDCIRVLLSLPPVVRADILSMHSISALLSLSQPSSPPSSFSLHASSTLQAAELLPAAAFQPLSLDALPPAPVPASGQLYSFENDSFLALLFCSSFADLDREALLQRLQDVISSRFLCFKFQIQLHPQPVFHRLRPIVCEVRACSAPPAGWQRPRVTTTIISTAFSISIVISRPRLFGAQQ